MLATHIITRTLTKLLIWMYRNRSELEIRVGIGVRKNSEMVYTIRPCGLWHQLWHGCYTWARKSKLSLFRCDIPGIDQKWIVGAFDPCVSSGQQQRMPTRPYYNSIILAARYRHNRYLDASTLLRKKNKKKPTNINYFIYYGENRWHR